MALNNSWTLLAAAALLPVLLPAQTDYLTVAKTAKVVVKPKATAEVKIPVQLQSGFHVNSNTPSEEYLIPLRLTWEKSAAFETVETIFPEPQTEKYEFSPKPLSVFTGDFEIVARVKARDLASSGPGILLGKLRYQACSKTVCYRPRTIEVRLPYQIQ